MCEVPFLVLVGGLSSSSLCLFNILQIYADCALHILMSVVDIKTFPNPSASRPAVSNEPIIVESFSTKTCRSSL